ncbi:unnamed protein product [Effrenium voratum]|nr:unnamed protein product [Effrenium voratum]
MAPEGARVQKRVASRPTSLDAAGASPRRVDAAEAQLPFLSDRCAAKRQRDLDTALRAKVFFFGGGLGKATEHTQRASEKMGGELWWGSILQPRPRGYASRLEDFIRKISGGGGRYARELGAERVSVQPPRFREVLPLPLKREAQRHLKAARGLMAIARLGSALMDAFLEQGSQGQIFTANPATFGSTKDLLLGPGPRTRTGQILHVVIEFANGVGKEKTVKTAFEFERVPVVGVHRERVFSGDGLERLVLFACAGAFLHAFVGTSLESLLQRYAGEKVGHRTRVFEVPYDSPYGDLQVDDACVGEPGTKVLFWLTGVGVVAAKVQATVGEDSAGCVESPPGLVRFPGGKAQGNSVSPPPLPKVPRSMALTRFHLIFAFEDRWVAVSRITHEVVQQQDWASSTYGPLRSLANDVHGHRLWICSERHAFELVAEKEDRNVWALLLRLEQFDDALAACQRPSERMRVLAAHADWLFRKGPDMELEAARKFAQATAVPFEHVALRFLHRKAALLEYLRCRLRRAEDQVTRALLSVWAVEISLAQLNEHPDRSSDTHAELQKELVELLRQCSDLDVHATIYHLLQSHGWLDELAMFAEMRKDYTTATWNKRRCSLR